MNIILILFERYFVLSCHFWDLVALPWGAICYYEIKTYERRKDHTMVCKISNAWNYLVGHYELWNKNADTSLVSMYIRKTIKMNNGCYSCHIFTVNALRPEILSAIWFCPQCIKVWYDMSLVFTHVLSSWSSHDMEMLSALLALCERNPLQ